MQSHLDELRADSVLIADVLMENEDEIRTCPGDCTDCEYFNVCQDLN